MCECVTQIHNLGVNDVDHITYSVDLGKGSFTTIFVILWGKMARKHAHRSVALKGARKHVHRSVALHRNAPH